MYTQGKSNHSPAHMEYLQEINHLFSPQTI